jgi:hypothetical protein
MSAHDARYEDSPAYDDEPGTTATRTDEQSVESSDRDSSDRDLSDRDDVIDRDESLADSLDRDDVADRDDAVDRDDVDRDDVVVDSDDSIRPDEATSGPVVLPADAKPEGIADEHEPAADSAPVTIVDGDKPADYRTDGDIPATTDETTAVPVTGGPDTLDGTEASVGPDTETGATKDPVPDGAFAATPVATPATPETATSSAVDWRELQGKFVDDPQAAVKEAGALVEKALSDLRTRSENGSTEELRTAFRRYRDLHAGLS